MPTNTLLGKFILLCDIIWGDNAKGSIALRLARFLKKHGLKIKWAIKPNGGGNSGHSYRNDEGIFCKSHNMPLAVFDPDITAIIGAGTVVDLGKLQIEMNTLAEQGVAVERTRIDCRAQIILPIYKTVEQALEELKGKQNIGTTANAIGPTYAMQAFRFGPTFNDLLDTRKRAEQKIRLAYELANAFLNGCNLPEEKFDLDQILEMAQEFSTHVCDTLELFEQIRKDGEIGIIEPGQGLLLDRIFGTYPFVTSSLTTPGGLLGHAGLSLQDIAFTLGIAKLYTTRVGSGPFPGEDLDLFGKQIRKNGDEYGVTTKRPRRCGPIDYVLLRHALRMAQPDLIAFTKLDTLDDFEEIPIIYDWEFNGMLLEFPPADTQKWHECKTRADTMAGWQEPTGQCKGFGDLPKNAIEYIRRIKDDWNAMKLFHTELGMVTVGEKLDQMIVLDALRKKLGL